MTAIRSTANGFHSISLNRFFGTRSKNSNMSTSGSALSSSALSSVVTRFSSVPAGAIRTKSRPSKQIMSSARTAPEAKRSEERRVGKGGASTGESRWSPADTKKKKYEEVHTATQVRKI